MVLVQKTSFEILQKYLPSVDGNLDISGKLNFQSKVLLFGCERVMEKTQFLTVTKPSSHAEIEAMSLCQVYSLKVISLCASSDISVRLLPKLKNPRIVFLNGSASSVLSHISVTLYWSYNQKVFPKQN